MGFGFVTLTCIQVTDRRTVMDLVKDQARTKYAKSPKKLTIGKTLVIKSYNIDRYICKIDIMIVQGVLNLQKAYFKALFFIVIRKTSNNI